MKKKVLISTIQPVGGGVPQMLKFVVNCLQQKDYQITIAYYKPYSVSKDLSVPLHKSFFKKPGMMLDNDFENVSCIAVGCWLPELEITHYWSSKRWHKLISSHDIYLTVSGSCMAALHYVQYQLPFFAWIATDWTGDRAHRVKEFPLLRRLLDRIIVKPLALMLEKRIIRSENLIALSGYTLKQLNKLSGHEAVENIMYIPVDTKLFRLEAGRRVTGRVGFVGRFEDPRKNIKLLIEAVNYVKQNNQEIELVLVGAELSGATKRLIAKFELQDVVICMPYIDHKELSEFLSTLDVFVLPSYQEGLCIAALEAMSCGVPVVSTRCGGPEDFIEHKKNGLLTSFDVEDMGKAILHLLSDQIQRQRYSLAARQAIIDRFSNAVLQKQFWKLFEQAFSNKFGRKNNE